MGPQFFRDKQAPHYPLGIGAMLCAFAVMMATGILYATICAMDNKRRDRKYGSMDKECTQSTTALNVIPDDITDKKNELFRYTY